ncbi:Chitin synthase 4 [Mycena kentingensis (nom. inval.)]|nr:Chitin synthase 4 [Mycena kentingensis (nom. inval.)]
MRFSAFPLVGIAFVGLVNASDNLDESSILGRDINASYLSTLTANQRKVFDTVIEAVDASFAPPFLFNSPRYTAWYAVGLLARNGKGDAQLASTLLRNVIAMQYTDPAKAWFGTFKSIPTAPDPGTVYPPRLYGSYDTNIGLFVCTSLIIAMEEFTHLLEPSLVSLLKASMYNSTVGDGYRVGGVNGDGYSAGGFIGDNLYPIYSNPWYMRIVAATYVGSMMQDRNMSEWGDRWAQEAVDNFNLFGTLAEFSSGTYTGVTLYALSLHGYMPASSVIARNAVKFIQKTWNAVGAMYNPTLRTLGGPWDRAYGYDMRAYFGILGGQIAGLVGGLDDGTAPLPNPLIGSAHFEDSAATLLTPLIAKFNDPHVPKSVISQLQRISSLHGHSSNFSAISPPWDAIGTPRNYTSYTAPGLSVGGIQSDERVIGGPATNPAMYVPASVLWDVDGQGTVGWLNLFPTSGSISAIATPSESSPGRGAKLTITYPPSTNFPTPLFANITSTQFTFLIGGFQGVSLPADFAQGGAAQLPGLRLKFSGNVVSRGVRSFVYGASTINDLMPYNLTFDVTGVDLGGEVPGVVLEVERV